jgi:hypothetical protein
MPILFVLFVGLASHLIVPDWYIVADKSMPDKNPVECCRCPGENGFPLFSTTPRSRRHLD